MNQNSKPRRFDNPNTFQKRSRPSGPVITLLIHHKAAGAVIGKGGENIKRLREQYSGVDIKIPDSQAPERVVFIDGGGRDLQVDCVRDMLGKLDEIGMEKLNQKSSEIRLLVHASHAGAVIGRGGSKIKEIREKSGCDIKVYSERCPMSTDRCVRLQGSHDAIMEAVRIVYEICDETPVKGDDIPYDSNNYDLSYIEIYGGFEPDKSFRGFAGAGGDASMTQAYGLPPGGRGGMRGGPGGRGGGFGNRGGGFAGGVGPRGGGGGGGGGPVGLMGANTGGNVLTNQVTIPDELAGVVIGKGGDRIARIRMESGADIAIDTEKNAQGERIITITGSQNQIQMAQFLLQQAVRQSQTGRQYIETHMGGRSP